MIYDRRLENRVAAAELAARKIEADDFGAGVGEAAKHKKRAAVARANFDESFRAPHLNERGEPEQFTSHLHGDDSGTAKGKVGKRLRGTISARSGGLEPERNQRTYRSHFSRYAHC